MRGNLKEVRPGVYKLRVYLGRDADGRTKFRTETVHGKRDAENRLAELVTETLRIAEPVAGDETLSQLLAKYIDHCEHMDRSPTTIRKYRSLAKHIGSKPIGLIRLRNLTAAELDKFYADEKRRVSATSVRRYHTLIGAALHQAEKWGWVDRNVTKLASPPPVRPNQKALLTLEELAKVITEANRRDPQMALMLTFLAHTGMRRGEACALRWTDVDWDAGTVTVSRSLYEISGGGWAEKSTKTHAERTLSLDENGLELLRRRRAAAEGVAEACLTTVAPDGFVFAASTRSNSSEPVRPDHLTKFLDRCAKKVGVSTHLHQLRHFSATQLISQGLDVVTVAGRLGHRDATVTLKVYAHALPTRDQDAARAIGSKLAGIMPPAAELAATT